MVGSKEARKRDRKEVVDSPTKQCKTSTDKLEIQNEEAPKSLAAPPTAQIFNPM